MEDRYDIGVDIGEGKDYSVEFGYVSGVDLVGEFLKDVPKEGRIFFPLDAILNSSRDSVTFRSDVAMEFDDKIAHWRNVQATIRRFEDWQEDENK